jgi:hypothetical protein
MTAHGHERSLRIRASEGLRPSHDCDHKVIENAAMAADSGISFHAIHIEMAPTIFPCSTI